MKERLTPKQIAALKTALDGRMAALRTSLREHLLKSDDERMRLLADRVRDAEDESVADLIVDLDLAEIDRDIEELRDVDSAFERLRRGAYGVCVGCQGAIPYERLTVYPTAKRCVRCQRMHEKTYAHPASPSL
jgi:RNA polymerase-binding transcription factor DksA